MMKLVSRWTSLIRSHDGPLTRELERRPGRFGLGQLPSRLVPDATARTVCGFCSTGCGLLAHLREGEAMNLSPDPAYPVNRGTACPKGWEALSPLVAEDRATMPLIRDPDRNAFREASWSEAARAFVDGMRAVQDAHGPEAAAFLGTGQIPTEELLFLGSLAKFGMGMVDGDGNTRQCMATAARAYKESFGFDAPPYCYADLEASDVIVLIGSNLCIAHPILWERIHRNPHHPEIIVVDPRRTETAIAGTQHLPIQPKSDLVLFYGLARWLISNGAVNQEFVDRHTEGFAAFRSFVEDHPIERVLAATGLTEETFLAFARSVRDGKRVSYWWTMGVNQSHEGVRLAQAIINLSLLTGQIGRPGTGPNSITGQCNAMGSRLFSNTSNLLGGREFENPGDRREVAAILGIPVDRIPTRSSRSYDGILDAVRAGEIKALWIVATNTAHSWIDSSVLAEIRDKLDFLVVQDMYTTTDTARLADLVLPAAGWGEKDGSFINSERRFGRVRKLRRAPGQALSDFQIFRLLAHHLDLDPTVAPLFAGWKDPEDVFSAIKEISRDRPCDISGIRDYRMLEQSGGIQWPFPAHAATEPIDPDRGLLSERRLFADGIFPREGGRALFVFEPPRPVAEPVDDAFPFVLMTGRGSSTQWHTETRTGQSGVLRSLDRQPTRLQMHPRDASRLGLSDGERVEVRSRRGTLQAILQATPTVLEGTLFVSMHDPGTNRLTFPDFDPYSRQPSYKHCAVSVSAASGGS